MMKKVKKSFKLLILISIIILCLLLALKLRWGDILTNLSLANYIGWQNIYRITSEKDYIELQLYPIVYGKLNCDENVKIKEYITQIENFLLKNDAYNDKKIRIVFRSAYRWDRGFIIQNYSFNDSELFYDSFCVFATNSTSIQILEKLTDLNIIELYTHNIRIEEVDLLKDFYSLETVYVSGILDADVISSIELSDLNCRVFLEQELSTIPDNVNNYSIVL